MKFKFTYAHIYSITTRTERRDTYRNEILAENLKGAIAKAKKQLKESNRTACKGRYEFISIGTM